MKAAQRLFVLMLVAGAFTGEAELISKIGAEGSFTVEKVTGVGILLSAKIIKPDYSSRKDRAELIINGQVLGQFAEAKKKRRHAVWNYEAPQALPPGEYEISLKTTSAWLDEVAVRVIAWRGEGRDMSGYISGLAAGLKQYLELNDLNKARLELDGGRAMKNLVGARLKRLHEDWQAVGDIYENADKINTTCDNNINAAETVIGKKEDEVAARQAAVQEMNTTLYELRKELDGETDPDKIRELTGRIAALEKKINSAIKEIAKLNQVIYHQEEVIKENRSVKEKVAEIVENYPEIKAELEEEIARREADYAALTAVIREYEEKIEDGDPPSATDGGDTTIIVKEEKNGYSLGEVFGIACIPACGIALPVGVAVGVAYTELRLPEPESGYETPDAAAEEVGNEAAAASAGDRRTPANVKAERARGEGELSRAQYIRQISE